MPGRRVPKRPPEVADIEYARRTWRGGIDGSKSVPRPVPLEQRVDVEIGVTIVTQEDSE